MCCEPEEGNIMLMLLFLMYRKLCILKGVFPREPKKKVKGGHQTYYHVKDIMFLKHEPILEKLREMRAYEKKVKKAMSKKNRDLAERLLSRKPTYTLDMLIRERLVRVVSFQLCNLAYIVEHLTVVIIVLYRCPTTFYTL